jgi:hypothetical protein
MMLNGAQIRSEDIRGYLYVQKEGISQFIRADNNETCP